MCPVFGKNQMGYSCSGTCTVQTSPLQTQQKYEQSLGRVRNENPGFGRGGSSEELLPPHWEVHEEIYIYDISSRYIIFSLIAVNC